MLIGAHESAAGGVHAAIARAERDECEALQVFVRQNRRWASGPIGEDEVAAFRKGLSRSPGIRAVVAHDIYLVNLAAPDPDLHRRSTEVVVDEMERCARLGIPRVVFHAGSPGERGEEWGLTTLARTLDTLLETARKAGLDVIPCLENSAGQGATLCRTVEEIEEVLHRMEHAGGLGLCLDTCHAFAAGYRIDTAAGWEEFLGTVDERLGLSRVKAFHLNDSKAPAGSRLDRHAVVGEGYLGAEAFGRMVRDPRLAEVPGILEFPDAPGSDTPFRHQVRLLRSLREA